MLKLFDELIMLKLFDAMILPILTPPGWEVVPLELITITLKLFDESIMLKLFDELIILKLFDAMILPILTPPGCEVSLESRKVQG